MPELSKKTRFTHRIHTYPAKLIPHIPNYLIKNFSKKNDTILDPFCGSGTTLLESILCHRNALGIELNPVARLIAKVKITPLDNIKLTKSIHKFGKKIKCCDVIKSPDFPNKNLWFSPLAQRELAKIKHTIDSMDADPNIYDFLLVCFSAIIKKVSNADLRDVYPRVAKQKTQPNVLDEFLKQLNFNSKQINKLPNYSSARLIGCDAKKIDLRRKSRYGHNIAPLLIRNRIFS